jgi:hypothetical protein
MKVFSTNNFWLDLDLIRAATEKRVKGTRKEKRKKREDRNERHNDDNLSEYGNGGGRSLDRKSQQRLP